SSSMTPRTHTDAFGKSGLAPRWRSNRSVKFRVDVTFWRIPAEESLVMKLIDESGQNETVSLDQGIQFGMGFLLVFFRDSVPLGSSVGRRSWHVVKDSKIAAC